MPVYGLKKVAFSSTEKLGFFQKNRKGDVKNGKIEKCLQDHGKNREK